MVVDKQTLKVMSAFQRYVKSNKLSEIASYSLKELQQADRVLGHRDTNDDFRIALRSRIETLKEEEKRKYQSQIRAIQYIVTFAIAVLAALLTTWLND